MRMRIWGAVLLGYFLTATADGAAQPEAGSRTYTDAQAAVAEAGVGGGGFYDWIHKLSGPAFGGPRVSVFYELGSLFRGEPGPRIRLDVATRWAMNKEGKVDPDSVSITMQTVQLGLEFPIIKYPLYVAPGFAVHRFSSDAFDDVETWSVPVTIGFRPRTGWQTAGLIFIPVLDATLHYFPRFAPGDFQPVTVTVSREDSEAVLQFSIGVDIRR